MVIAVIAAALIFIAVAGVVLAILSTPARAVERRIQQLGQQAEAQPVDNVLRRDSGTFPFLRSIVNSGWSERARLDILRAGLSLKVSEYLMIRLALAAILGVVVFFIFGGSGTGFMLGIVGAFVGYMAFAWFLAIRRARRIDKLNAQLPEALALISNSLRSGFAFTQAVELAAKQMESPISEEFGEFLRDTSLGAPMDEALRQLGDRTGSYDIEMMVSTILIQRTTGGNLSEILDNVATTIRERERLQGEIKALTASQRFTGFVLSIYPLGLMLLLVGLAPSIYKVLWTEEGGRILMIIAAVLQGMGIFTIRRILRLEV
jgi:tight adherence protein B